MPPENTIMDPRKTARNLTAAKKGDQAAFRYLMDAYYPVLFRLVFQIVPNFQDVEDILQDTFFRFHKALGRVREEDDPLPFIKTIAVRRAYSLVKRSRQDHLSLDDLPGELPDLDLAGTPARLEKVYALVQNLPPRRRVVFILREILGIEDAEIARLLSIRETTVRRHASMARDALKSYLEK